MVPSSLRLLIPRSPFQGMGWEAPDQGHLGRENVPKHAGGGGSGPDVWTSIWCISTQLGLFLEQLVGTIFVFSLQLPAPLPLAQVVPVRKAGWRAHSHVLP